MSQTKQKDLSEAGAHSITINVGSYHEIPFAFTFYRYGAGTCKDIDDGRKEVSFTWDPASLDLTQDNIEDALQELAHTLFWDEINDQLDDPILREDDMGSSEELIFEGGCNEELEEIVRLSLYAFPALWEDGREEVDITIRARSEWEDAHLDEYCDFMEDKEIPDELKRRVRELIELALNWIDPYGWSLEYNDGAYERASGYSECAATIAYTISRPSFHELAEAREDLLAVFAAHDLREEAEKHLPEGE
jgi:hypothetical protein